MSIHEVGIGNLTFELACAVLLSGNNNLFYNNLCYHSMNGVGVTGTSNKVLSNTFNQMGFSGCNCTAVINLFGSTSAVVQNAIIWDLTATTAISTTGSTTPTVDHNLTTDPLFVDPTNHIFTLQAGSNAIGTGVDLSSIFTTDYAGLTRTVPWTIGAYKFVPSGTGLVWRLPASATALRVGAGVTVKLGQTN